MFGNLDFLIVNAREHAACGLAPISASSLTSHFALVG
jgi:hypothetical protein